MRYAVTLMALALAGCDVIGGNDGPLALGIVAGNHQTATAGSDRLTDPVVGKLVRTSDGGITMRLVRPAYAQGTVVNGSPVPGAVVCAVSVTEGGMVPWAPCTNTDDDGTATFFFTPGTTAGEALAEIRGTVEGEPAVFDTAVATVEPGALAAWNGEAITTSVGDTLALANHLESARDEWHNAIDPGTLSSLPIVWEWHPYRTATSTGSVVTPLPESPSEDAGEGWSVVAQDVDCSACTSESDPDALLVAWIDGVRSAWRVFLE